jgi:hypothetical protein
MISRTEGEIMPAKRNRGEDQIKWAKYQPADFCMILISVTLLLNKTLWTVFGAI